ncbi:fatty acyl-AMP ligase [Aquihabitans sp. G128]|uniref:fatty acyl-AMP ligase n=1 Tax=Aquihabitans sp. G128 TaxID=2849779 RepID=UPI001C215462|nr:fatty acyl-AMP ligase [Aquihabitans sp. G128]QXC61520.1 fatty acyl-AMP ligase [Aquihabitans sp. G128]
MTLATPVLPLTIPERLALADRRDGLVTFIDGDDAQPVRWSELLQDARGTAADLAARGVGPGSHVALLGPTTRDLVTTIAASWLAGATVVVLPLPMRMSSIEEFVEQTRRRILGADTALLVVDPELAPFLEAQPGDPLTLGYDDLRGDPAAYVAPAPDPEALAILQFTSGSTSDPKGVMLPHRTVLANVDAIAEALVLDPEVDVAVSWLPLYHDMGLVGILTSAMVRGVDLVLAGPQTFMASPARWVGWLSTYGGTITAGPNFSWVLAARALKRLDGLDLSPLRVALNGAEPVDPATVANLVEAGARHGLRAGAVFPAFGMAEVAIAGTFPAPMSGLRVDAVDQRVLETERYAAPVDQGADGSKAFARLGTAVPGLEIRVVDPDSGAVRQDREVGELQIRGTSVMTGYYRRPDATAAAFDGDWFRTGDLAYLIDGELVLCGRIKDVIIVAGRNVFPEDVERSVAEVEGVRAGNVIAFGVEGRRREGVVVVAEARSDDLAAVRGFVHACVRDVTGLAADDVVLVLPGTLPKTSSGKVQRSLCRDRYLGEELQPA